MTTWSVSEGSFEATMFGADVLHPVLGGAELVTYVAPGTVDVTHANRFAVVTKHRLAVLDILSVLQQKCQCVLFSTSMGTIVVLAADPGSSRRRN